MTLAFQPPFPWRGGKCPHGRDRRWFFCPDERTEDPRQLELPFSLDDQWQEAWQREHRWGRYGSPPMLAAWGCPQVPPRPAHWQPGASTELAWLQAQVYR